MHKASLFFIRKRSRWARKGYGKIVSKPIKKGLKRPFSPALVRYSNSQLFVPSGVWNRSTLLLAFCSIYLL